MRADDLEAPVSFSRARVDPNSGDHQSGLACDVPDSNSIKDREEDNESSCFDCGGGGELICCDGCPRAYHIWCVDVESRPLFGSDTWLCTGCQWTYANKWKLLGGTWLFFPPLPPALEIDEEDECIFSTPLNGLVAEKSWELDDTRLYDKLMDAFDAMVKRPKPICDGEIKTHLETPSKSQIIRPPTLVASPSFSSKHQHDHQSPSHIATRVASPQLLRASSEENEDVLDKAQEASIREGVLHSPGKPREPAGNEQPSSPNSRPTLSDPTATMGGDKTSSVENNNSSNESMGRVTRRQVAAAEKRDLAALHARKGAPGTTVCSGRVHSTGATTTTLVTAPHPNDSNQSGKSSKEDPKEDDSNTSSVAGVCTNKINVGPAFQAPMMPYHFLEALQCGVNYEDADVVISRLNAARRKCRLVYSNRKWAAALRAEGVDPDSTSMDHLKSTVVERPPYVPQPAATSVEAVPQPSNIGDTEDGDEKSNASFMPGRRRRGSGIAEELSQSGMGDSRSASSTANGSAGESATDTGSDVYEPNAIAPGPFHQNLNQHVHSSFPALAPHLSKLSEDASWTQPLRTLDSNSKVMSFMSKAAQLWPPYACWPFCAEFGFKLLQYSNYNGEVALSLLSTPGFDDSNGRASGIDIQSVADPPTRPYLNKWRPSDRRGYHPAVPYPPPNYLRSMVQNALFASNSSGGSLKPRERPDFCLPLELLNLGVYDSGEAASLSSCRGDEPGTT